MNERPGEITFRRILVALDASSENRAALEAAVDLAARMEAELLGLFVEDVNLLRLARLSSAREVRFARTLGAPPSMGAIRRGLKVQAATARRALEAAAARRGLRWSFRVARGNVAVEILAVAPEVDLMIVGRTGGPLHSHARMGANALAVAAGAPRAVLVPGRIVSDGPTLAVYDESPMASRALATAARLTGGEGMVVLVPDVAANGKRDLVPEVEAWLKRHGVAARVRRVAPAHGLAAAVNEEFPRVCVLSRECACWGEESAEKVVDDIDALVLLIGGAGEAD